MVHNEVAAEIYNSAIIRHGLIVLNETSKPSVNVIAMLPGLQNVNLEIKNENAEIGNNQKVENIILSS